jgi:hypothetical protein
MFPLIKLEVNNYMARSTFKTNSHTGSEIHHLLFNTMRIYPRGPLIFEKSRGRLPVLGARRLTRRKFCTEDPHLGVTCERHGYLALSAWCIWIDTHFLCKEKTAIIRLKILGATIQHLVAQATRRPGLVHPCIALFTDVCYWAHSWARWIQSTSTRF